MVEMRNVYRIILDGKPEGKRPLGRPRRNLEDNIKMGLREIEWEGVDLRHGVGWLVGWLVGLLVS
jgi:hypothetical protein